MDITETQAERQRVRLIQRLLGLGAGQEEAEAVLYAADGEEELLSAALKEIGVTPSGRRLRDRQGRVIDKPYSPGARRQEDEQRPRRDSRGYRLSKPNDPRRR